MNFVLVTDPGSFKLTDIWYRLRFSFACIVRSLVLHSCIVRLYPLEAFKRAYGQS